MIQEVENIKGFKVLKVSRLRMLERLWKYGCIGICDFCAEIVDEGYYVAVLNQWLCQECYEDWMRTAINYPEDREIEQRNYEAYKEILK